MFKFVLIAVIPGDKDVRNQVLCKKGKTYSWEFYSGDLPEEACKYVIPSKLHWVLGTLFPQLTNVDIVKMDFPFKSN